MPTDVIKTIGVNNTPVNPDYSTLQGWEDAAPSDLTLSRSNTTQAGSTSSTIVLDSGASAVDDFYKGHPVWCDARTSEKRLITAYNGTTKVAAIGVLNGSSATWANTPGTENYTIDSCRWIGECLDQGEFVDGTGLNISGSTTDSSSYLIIRCAAGAGFASKVAGRPLDYSAANGVAYRRSGNYGGVMSLSVAYTQVIGIQIKGDGANQNGVSIGSTCTLDSCIVRTSASFGGQPAIVGSGSTTVKNCLIITQSGGIQDSTTSNDVITGNTIVFVGSGSYTGIAITNYGGALSALIRNNAVLGFSTTFGGNTSIPGGFNATDKPSFGMGSNNQTNLILAHQFFNATNDFRVRNGSRLYRNGTPDTTNTPTDITGQVRHYANPTIGCFEFRLDPAPNSTGVVLSIDYANDPYNDSGYTLDLENPLADHSLNRGIVGEWVCLPDIRGGWLLNLCNKNYGRLINGPTISPSSRPGGLAALNFTASASQRVDISLPSTTSSTLAAWVKGTAIGGDDFFGYPYPNYAPVLILNGNTSVAVGFGGTTAILVTVPNMANVWNHFAITTAPSAAGGFDIVLYMNGRAIGSVVNAANGGTSNGTQLAIGNAGQTGFNNYADGQAEGLIAYNRTLSPTEVWGLYDESRQGNPNRWNRSSTTAFSFALSNPGVLLTGSDTDPYGYPADNIDLENPVDTEHPFARGLNNLWAVLPQLRGGARLFDLMGRNHGNMQDALWGPPLGSGRPSLVLRILTSTSNVSLGNSDQMLSTTAATFAFWYKKTDATNRASGAFGLASGTNAERCGVHLPYDDGTVYWDFGGILAPNRISVSGLTFREDHWIFDAGPLGMRIYQNGVLRASSATPATRSGTSAPFMLGAHGGTGPDNALIGDFAHYRTQFSDPRFLYEEAKQGLPHILRRIPAVLSAGTLPAVTNTGIFLLGEYDDPYGYPADDIDLEQPLIPGGPYDRKYLGWWTTLPQFSNRLINLARSNHALFSNGPTLTQQAPSGRLGSTAFVSANQTFAQATVPNLTYDNTTQIVYRVVFRIDSTSQKGCAFKHGGEGNTEGVGIGVGSTDFDTNGNNILVLFEASRWITVATGVGTGWFDVVVAVSYNTLKCAAWVNGVRVLSDTGGFARQPSNRVRIGGYDFGGSNRGWTGLIAEASLSVGHITDAVVAGLYNDARLGYPETVARLPFIFSVPPAIATAAPPVAGVTTVSPDTILVGTTLGSPTLTSLLTVSPDTIASGTTVGTPAISLSITIGPDTIDSGSTLGSPTLTSVMTIAALIDPFDCYELPADWLDLENPVNWNGAINDGLLAWWLTLSQYNGTRVIDLVRGNHGALSGLRWVSSSRKGACGALAFGGVSTQFVTLPGGNLIIPPNTDKLTLSAWVNPTTTSVEGRVITFQSGGSNRLTLAVGLTSGKASICFRDSGGSFQQLDSGINVNPREWTWLCAVVSGTTVTFYVKSGNTTTITSVGTYSSATSIGAIDGTPAAIGYNAGAGGAAGFFSGQIDDIRIHKRAFTSLQVEELYQASLRGWPDELNRLPQLLCATVAVVGATVSPTSIDPTATIGTPALGAPSLSGFVIDVDGYYDETIDAENPINWEHPLNHGLLADWTIISPHNGKPIELTGRFRTTLALGPVAITPRTLRLGGYGSLYCNGGYARSTLRMGSPSTNPFTVMCWFRSDDTTLATMSAFSLRDAAVSGLNFETRGGNWTVSTYGGGLTISTGVGPDNLPHHMAYTWNGSVGRVYLDGRLMASNTTAPQNFTPSLAFMGTFDDTFDRWNGAVDAARVYNRSLSTAEITAIYEDDKTGGSLRYRGAKMTLAAMGFAITDTTVTPDTITSGSTLGSPTLTAGTVTISPDTIATGSTLGSPTLSMVITISPTTITSGAALGSPTLSSVLTVSPDTITSGSTIGSPALSMVITVTPDTLASGSTVGSPTLTLGTATISPTTITSTATLGDPNLGGISVTTGAFIDLESYNYSDDLDLENPLNLNNQLNQGLLAEWVPVAAWGSTTRLLDLRGRFHGDLLGGVKLACDGYSFDGVDDNVRVDSVSYQFATGPLTYIGYLTYYSAPGGSSQIPPPIFECREAPSNNDTSLGIYNNQPVFMGYSGAFNTATGPALVPGQTYHIAATHTPGGQAILYVNGVEVARSGAFTRSTTPYSTKTTIGRIEGTTPAYLKFKMYSVSVYNRGLTAAEIKEHYQEALLKNPSRWNRIPQLLTYTTTGASAFPVSPDTITSTATLGNPTLTAGTATVSPNTITSGSTVGQADLSIVITVSPNTITSGSTIGAPTLSFTLTVSPNTIAAGTTLGNPTLTPGVATISPNTITSGATLGNPTLTSVLTVSPNTITSTATLGSPAITQSTVTIVSGLIDQVDLYDTFPDYLELDNLLNGDHPLNAGLLVDMTAVPQLIGSSRMINLSRDMHGTLTNAVTRRSNLGRQGGFASWGFDGVSSFSNLGNPQRLRLIASCSLGIWFKTTTTAFAHLIGCGDGLSLIASRISIRIFSGKLNNLVVKSDGNTNVNPNPTNVINDDKWHHTMLTYDQAFVRTYLDGVLVDTASTAGWADLNSPITPFTIGCTPDGSTAPFAGALDGATVHSRALSPSQVLELYQEMRQGNPNRWNRSKLLLTAAASTAYGTLQPTSIDSTATIGTPALTLGTATISPDTIASGSTIGAPTLSFTLTVSPNTLTSGSTIGTPALSLTITVSPNTITSGSTIGSPTLSMVITVSPTTITSGATIGSPVLTGGTVSIVPNTITSGSTVGSPSLSAGVVSISPTTIAGGSTVGTPSLSLVITVSPTTITSGATLGSPTLSSALTVSPTTITTGSTVGTPSITLGTVVIQPGTITSTVDIGEPFTDTGLAVIFLDTITSTATLGAPSLALGVATISPASKTSTTAVGTPTLTAGVAIISPNSITSTVIVSSDFSMILSKAKGEFDTPFFGEEFVGLFW